MPAQALTRGAAHDASAAARRPPTTTPVRVGVRSGAAASRRAARVLDQDRDVDVDVDVDADEHEPADDYGALADHGARHRPSMTPAATLAQVARPIAAAIHAILTTMKAGPTPTVMASMRVANPVIARSRNVARCVVHAEPPREVMGTWDAGP